MKKANLMISVILLSVISLYAGKKPIKYGRVDKEALEMTVCALDSTASAVVLCDYGYFNGSTYQFTRTLRIKILRKEGLNYASRVFHVPDDYNIKGVTYNLVDGEVVESKLKKSQIFSERVYRNYFRQRVTMPNVEVGSVFDIQITSLGLPMEWYFQQTIPVLRSELVLESTIYVSYRKNFFGYFPLSRGENESWLALNVPAFKEEPFMNSSENYITKFEFDIIEVSFPGYFKNVTSDWESLSNTLYQFDHFGVPLKSVNLFLKSMAKVINKKNLNDEEKIIAAVDTLHSIKWNGYNRLLTTEKELRFQYSKGVGNSADINLGLVVLLRKLGFETYPVVLSTRSNGLMSIVSPTLEKLNYVVALTKLNGKFILVDATEELLPYNLVPPRCLNQKGRIIDRDTTAWFSIVPQGKYKSVSQYNLTLDSEMNLSGKLVNAYYDYAAYDIRKEIEKIGDVDDYIDNNAKTGLIINEADIENVDDIYSPLKETFDVTIEDVAIVTDSLVYLQLMPFNKLEANSFNNDERLYPIDFTYPRERSGTISITLPNNVEVIEIPEPLRLGMPDKSVDYIYSVSQIGNKIILNYRMRIVKPMIYVSEYPNLRTMYEYVIQKEDQPLVLRYN